MKIRKARKTDLPDLLELFYQLDIYHLEKTDEIKPIVAEKEYRKNYLLEKIFDQPDKLLAVVEDGGKVVAAGLGMVNRRINHIVFKDSIIGEITDLIVHKKRRQEGLGKSLMNYLEGELALMGCTQFELTVYNFNGEAVSFYEKSGYAKKKTRYVKNRQN